ncbi:hypothetical protein SV13_00490, partial [Clostridium perfringens]|uniref:glycosyltransferase n=1 Tax=Clostridium perfringens TaxID=1502 RepID=UPI0013D26AE9
MALISIIIPVYNAEDYLEKCVNSVLVQEFKDIEIILVNDGSKDNSLEVCNNLKKRDSRIKVINKKNGGSSDARNFGIRESNGTYLMFLDSDDYWQGTNCLNNIVYKLKNNDIEVLLYGCTDYNVEIGEVYISRTGYNNDIITKSDKKEILEYLFKNNLFPGSAWITVTKRNFIIENNLFFTKGIKSEDIDWLLSVFLKANKFDSVDDYFYIYLRNRPNSITGSINKKSIEDLLYIIEKWSRIIEENKEYFYIKDYVNDYLSYHLLFPIA